MIIPIYQPLGSSTHLLAQRVGQQHQVKATHTGTLDPMAEGVVVVLTEEDRFKKTEFSAWKKTYEFKILWGTATDTYDLLGKITAHKRGENPDLEKLRALQDTFIGKHNQEIPHFSAKRSTEQQFSNIEIFAIEMTDANHESIQSVLTQLHKVIPKLKNEFRQEEIVELWESSINNLPDKEETKALITSHRAVTSKRTYIRQLVHDLSTKMQIPATTFHINRTANGPYSTQDCLCLI